MKVLFTADLHIKLGQKNVPVEWAKNRYNLLFTELAELQNKVDLVIIGGDIFDKMPSIEELELYFNMINRFVVHTIIYSGNHEAVKKNTTFFTNLAEVSKSINDNIQIVDNFETIYGMDFIPYNKLKEYHPADIDFHGDILFTHVRGEIPPHVKSEVPLELFDRWKVVLAGDLHSYDNCQRNILYPGSPITTSFHRNEVDTGVILFDTDTLGHEWVKLKLPQLIRKTVQAGDIMEATEYHHTIYEVEGDISQLSGMENSDLLDKKVVKRNTDTTIILSPDLTIEEEVEEYLRYVLELTNDSVEQAIKVLGNYMEKIRE